MAPAPRGGRRERRVPATLTGGVCGRPASTTRRPSTGCRSAVPELDTSIFIIPGWRVKNGEDRVVVLNRIARSVVDARRGKHAKYVFVFAGKPIQRMLSSAWKKARVRAGLDGFRVHDLKHTFGRRLRAAGVSFEDRQDLLGHRSGRVTTHYSAADLSRLIEAANSVCERDGRRPELVVLRGALKCGSRKIHARDRTSLVGRG